MGELPNPKTSLFSTRNTHRYRLLRAAMLSRLLPRHLTAATRLAGVRAIAAGSLAPANGAQSKTFQADPCHEFVSTKTYQGQVNAIILDWAGTVVDCGVYAPVVVFIKVFEEFGVPISMEEAREPMGRHKKVHFRMITQMEGVRRRWHEKHGRYPNEQDVEEMFARGTKLQISCMEEYSTCIPGAVDTVTELQSRRGLKIGSTTGFTTPMMEVLKVSAAKQGYKPDAIVCADEVPQARPFIHGVGKSHEAEHFAHQLSGQSGRYCHWSHGGYHCGLLVSRLGQNRQLRGHEREGARASRPG